MQRIAPFAQFITQFQNTKVKLVKGQENVDNLNISSITAYSGIVTINRKYLEKLKTDNRKSKINVAGLLVISKDVSPELVKETIESVVVHGIILASREVKKVLCDNLT